MDKDLLQQALNEIDNYGNEEIDSYRIENYKDSIYAFEQIQLMQRKKEEVQKISKSLIQEKTQRIAKWLEDELNPIESRISYYETKLIEYYKEQKEQDPKFKLTSPYGAVTSRTTSVWRYEEDKVIDFVKKNLTNPDEVLRTKVELNKNALKSLFPKGIVEETGEVISGIDIEKVTSINIKVEK